ncbi:MAG: hypothetical protein DRG78_08500 [Epsilonproteobacteria bacterium]|nr:MAG: hypothetical protein DRG78_08500 [Campylobacterota bacterium]
MNKKINTDFFLKVSTGKNLYNLDSNNFKCYLLNESTGSIITNTNPFSEVVGDVDNITATLTSDVEGVLKINLDDINGLLDGNVIQIDSSFYYIKEVNGNEITLLSPCDLHAASSTVTLVGNTGIYKVLNNIDTVGDYTAFISNAEINMQNHSCSLSVIEFAESDLTDQLTNLNDEIVRSSFI